MTRTASRLIGGAGLLLAGVALLSGCTTEERIMAPGPFASPGQSAPAPSPEPTA